MYKPTTKILQNKQESALKKMVSCKYISVIYGNQSVLTLQTFVSVKGTLMQILKSTDIFVFTYT